MFSYYWGGDKTSNFVINMLCSKNFEGAYSCRVVRPSVPNSCSAHNFVIWSRILKLFHRNDHHIEMTKFLACVQNLFWEHHPVRPALVFKLPTQTITFLLLKKKSPWIHTNETGRKTDTSPQNTGQVTLSTDQVYHGIGRKLGPDPLYKVFSNTGPSFKYFLFPSRDPGQFSMGS